MKKDYNITVNHKLFDLLKRGFVVYLHSFFDGIDVIVRKEDHSAKRTIRMDEILDANFDIISFAIDECVEMISDLDAQVIKEGRRYDYLR